MCNGGIFDSKQIMKRITCIQVASVSLILAGIVIALPIGQVWARQKTAALTPTSNIVITKPVLTPSAIYGKPVRIVMPSLNIDIKVVDGEYNRASGEWTLSRDKAQFALPSVQPNNESGNTLIYGHYRTEVFAALHTIQPSAVAYITTANGYKFSYTFTTSQAFDPTDTTIFRYQGPPRLTVQTCSGNYFQHRQMFYFTFDTVKKV